MGGITHEHAPTGHSDGATSYADPSRLAAIIPASGFLASCATSGTGTTPARSASSAPARVSDTNPFGMAANSTVDAVIFNGGYGIDYAEFAGKQVEKLQAGSTVKVTPATNIAQTLQPRFVAGNPPDVIDNSGAGLIGINTIRDQLEDLTDVIEAKNYEGAGDQGHPVRRASPSRAPSTASSSS